MNTDNQPTPDDGYRAAWKQAFDEAAETPPPRVWNAIERQLNTDDRARIIPLWWAQVQPWAAGVAATVAIVLLGWWTVPKQTPSTPLARQDSRQPGRLSGAHKESQSSVQAPTDIATSRGKRPAETPSEVDLAASATSELSRKPSRVPAVSTEPAASGLIAVTSADSRTGRIQPRPDLSVSTPMPGQSTRPDAGLAPATEPAGLNRLSTPALTGFGQVSPVAVALRAETIPVDESERVVLSAGRLSGKSLRSRQPVIERVVWFRNEDPLAIKPEQSTPGGRETWASVGVMPSVFNPAVGVQLPPMPSISGANAYVLNALYAAPKATPALRSESGVAVAAQLSAGAQLNNRWSVETGVGYLQAQSAVVSAVQISPAQVDRSADRTFYTAVVQNSISRKSQSASVVGNNAADYQSTLSTALYSSQTQSRTRNEYTFVQVPVQVGYQLRPRRKLGLSVLGGLLTNWFVHNAVGETLVVKPSDNVYRSLTLAGTAGVRFRYRSSRRWSASLAGIYQQSLQIGTQSDVSLETRPHTVGVSFGMDYHF